MAYIALVSVLTSLSYTHVSAAACSIPAPSQLIARDSNMCGGDSSLQQCGSQFPSDFCCPTSTTCLQLESSAMAVLCCPAGQDCKFISPINCDQKAQNATMFPGNQLHSDPTMSLEKCGDSCCPVGATCHSGLCAIQTATTSASSESATSTPPAASSSSSAPTSETTVSDSATSSSEPTSTAEISRAMDGVTISDGSTTKLSSADFSGKTFVAGFLPGILLGIIFMTLLMWCLSRRKRKRTNDYPNDKHFSTADQLTSLGADPYRLPMHTRSISEPVSDPSNGHRTDFVRGTPSPPRASDPQQFHTGYTATASGPITPARTPKMRPLFSHSSVFQTPPSPKSSNFPSYLKRGTLTHAYTISPIRALRPKKSSHSLRRQMTAAAAAAATTTAAPTNAPPPRHAPHRTRASTSTSTETIKVLMPQIELEARTPDQRKANAAAKFPIPPKPSDPDRHSYGTWATLASSPLVPEPVRTAAHDTPTRVPAAQAREADRALGAPCSLPRGLGQGLMVGREGDDARRQTTFSGFMERAGVGR
ncbi:hypothetical protein Q7P37_002665 [Cladosporium fusiforme]